MAEIRIPVGTRKGAFILTSDGGRKKWSVSGLHFAGWEVYHVKGSPADPDRIYASQTNEFGMPMGESNKFVYDTSAETGRPLTTHEFYDGTQQPWEFKRVWHLEPSLDDPDTVYAGVEDAALFRSSDGGGDSWYEVSGNLPSDFGFPIAVHAHEPETIYVVPIQSDALHYPPEGKLRVYRSRTGGNAWEALTRDLPAVLSVEAQTLR